MTSQVHKLSHVTRIEWRALKSRIQRSLSHFLASIQNTRQVSARHFEPGIFYIGIEKIMRKGTFEFNLDLQPDNTFSIESSQIIR